MAAIGYVLRDHFCNLCVQERSKQLHHCAVVRPIFPHNVSTILQKVSQAPLLSPRKLRETRNQTSHQVCELSFEEKIKVIKVHFCVKWLLNTKIDMNPFPFCGLTLQRLFINLFQLKFTFFLMRASLTLLFFSSTPFSLLFKTEIPFNLFDCDICKSIEQTWHHHLTLRLVIKRHKDKLTWLRLVSASASYCSVTALKKERVMSDEEPWESCTRRCSFSKLTFPNKVTSDKLPLFMKMIMHDAPVF